MPISTSTQLCAAANLIFIWNKKIIKKIQMPIVFLNDKLQICKY